MERGILVSQLGTEPQTLHGKCGVLTTRPPGKSQQPVYYLCASMADWLSPWMLQTPGDVSAVPHLHLQRCASKCPLHSIPLPICPLPPSASPTLSVSTPRDSPTTCLSPHQPQTPELPFIPMHPVLLPSPFPQLLESLILMGLSSAKPLIPSISSLNSLTLTEPNSPLKR